MDGLILPGEKWSKDLWQAFFQRRRALLWMAEGGFVLLTLHADEAEVMKLGVEPDKRRRGMGRTLMQLAEGRLKELGVKLAFLEVRASNETAQALYRSLGYQQAGIRRGYYQHPKEDAILFSKELES